MEVHRRRTGISTNRQHDSGSRTGIKGFACTTSTRFGRRVQLPRKFTQDRGSGATHPRRVKRLTRSVVKKNGHEYGVNANDSAIRPANRGPTSRATHRGMLASKEVRCSAVPSQTNAEPKGKDNVASDNNSRLAVSGSTPEKTLALRSKNMDYHSKNPIFSSSDYGVQNETGTRRRDLQRSPTNVMVAARTGIKKLETCEGCNKFLYRNNAWLVPWCFTCATRRFQIPTSPEGRETWDQTVKEISEASLAPRTIKAYEQTGNKTEWPLDSPYKIIQYLQPTAPSDSALKHKIATANKIHRLRDWAPPAFNTPLIEGLIQAIKRRPAASSDDTKTTPVFSKEDLQKIFTCLKDKKHPTDLRNWAIMAVQLLGVRRASEVLSLQLKDIQVKDGTFVIKVSSSKTDRRKKGLLLKIPKQSVFGFNPTRILVEYIASLRGDSLFLFPNFDPKSQQFLKNRITVNGWNKAIYRLCQRANIPPRTSHALRRSAISLSPIDQVEAVAQTGGWKSQCYWEVYRRFNLEERAAACAKIGARDDKSLQCTSILRR